MYCLAMGFYEDILARLGRAVETRFDGKPSRLAREAGTTTTVVSRILKGERAAWLQSFSKIADAAGLIAASADDPIEADRDICFVDARVVGVAGEGGPLPEEYLAVPLAEDPVAAGPGLIPSDKVGGWVLVWRRHESIRFKSNLIAVEIGRNENSMVPTLHPGGHRAGGPQ